MRFWDLVWESLTSVWGEARRTAPMAAGIAWGVASVFVLVAVGRGFEANQRGSLEALGDSFMLLRVNRSTATRGDLRSGFVRIDGDDIEAIKTGAPSLAGISPKANNWFMQAYRGKNLTRVVCVGVEPQYADIVNVPIEEGRWIDEYDLEAALPVCVLGPAVREELFGDAPAVGETIELVFSRAAGEDTIFRKVKVVGTVGEEELAGDEIYTSHRIVVFLPFTTWERMSPRDFQFFVLQPRDDVDREAALAEVRHVLAERHGFDPDEKNTLVPYFDAFERKQRIDQVFGGLEVFLGAVGLLILLLGAIGVANVVLMSVTARTFEFGLRRALGCKRRWIFTQVFLEASTVCFASGLLGFVLGIGGIELMGMVDLPEGFAAPRPELGAAWLPGILLLFASLGAAIWPAYRATRMSPSNALRSGGM
ncbi:MAG: putative ABC transport system permease protein [Planctomycetota bacterium]|jgi:putative ABC transport system permease protein